ncbi:hypothetical protein HWV62_37225 [Athelia sp. TMB]|nr:hypothetical protein HWV62_37225 [Athelia sp. TMB]
MHNARSKLLAQLRDLEAATRIVQNEYNGIVNCTSAIARIPNEILAIIFQEARSREDSLKFQASQVTRRWRDVAISIPRLWSRIHLTVDKLEKIQLFSLYLSRSKTVPVDLKVIERLDDEGHLPILGKLLADHIARCRQLTLDFASTGSAGIIHYCIVQAPAPLLESFDAAYLWEKGFHPPATVLRGGTPMLATIHLRAVPHYLPPLSSVTTLNVHAIGSLERISLETWRGIFRSLTQLLSLVIEGSAAPHGRNWVHARTLLYEAVEAPLLQSLTLQDFIDRDVDLLAGRWPLGAARFPALRTLILTGSNMHAQLDLLMSSFRHVQKVTVIGQNGEVVRGLLRALQDPMNWPALQTLSLPDIGLLDEHSMHQLLSYCITRRIEHGRPLETLVLAESVVHEVLMGAVLVDDGLPWFDLVRLAEYDEGEA